MRKWVRKEIWITVIITFAITMFIAASVFASNPIKIIVNGKEISPDVSPQIIDNRVMVPIRWVSEALGAEVQWDQENQRVIIQSVIAEDELVDEQEIIALVEQFGSKLKMVSLANSPTEITNNMQEHYGQFVVPELIAFWAANAEQAPGRLTSSPWPDRIDIESIEQTSHDAYKVTGRIVEVVGGGIAAATRSIELEIKKVDGRWLIHSSVLGTYETITHSDKEILAGSITLVGDTLYLDQVEVITSKEADRITGLNFHDPDRIAELGLEVGDMPNGYYIHDLNAESVAFELVDGTVYTFTDMNLLFVEDAESDRRYSTMDKEEFMLHILTSSGIGTYPFFIEVSDGKVMSITEIFLFTQ